jgi:hypothetical protein
VRLPGSMREVLQVIEYLRGFLVGRQGWAQFNVLLIISRASIYLIALSLNSRKYF